MRAPRVSVIIIFFNAADFLGEAIASVSRQTFTDWELILVDDGSTDASGSIARSAVAEGRIRYTSHPNGQNRGMSASRNLGIAESSGELIAFLDADDLWPPNKLTEQVALFDAHPATDMAYGRALLWHSWSRHTKGIDSFCDLGIAPDRLYGPGELLPLLIRNQAQTPMSGNAIMRRSLVERVGGFEDSFKGMFEDQIFFAKTHLRSRCHVDERVWLYYRQHENSCTALSDGSFADVLARRRFLGWLSDYLREHHVTDPEVRRALRAARRGLVVQTLRIIARKLLRPART